MTQRESRRASDYLRHLPMLMPPPIAPPAYAPPRRPSARHAIRRTLVMRQRACADIRLLILR